ncbi:hypothetical protein Ahy_B04g069774 [Arachis hypogaea]|uniref:Uncharacterized protein n=1 Tax=Arachis hypogaea TaxID=3818 RepID=A0A444ZDK9_ARAHY|nr:hypothetical protein Ahy_B04g069774 [Arachis hypogaea]
MSTLIYRMPVAVASSFAYQKMHIKSDQHVSMMFSYHRSIESIYSMELYVKLQDVGGSSSSSNNVEKMRNSGAGEAIPFSEIGRARSPSFNAFVAPAQNAENPDRCPSPNVHVAYPEGIAEGLADSSEEDEIEDDSGEEVEVVLETQPLEGDRVIPTQAEPINVMGVGGVSSSTPDHYLHLSLGPMNSTTAEDIPSNYSLTDATICVKVLQGSVESAYGYKVSYKKVWLAKQKAIARIYGDWDDSYNQLQRYFNALQTFIPG